MAAPSPAKKAAPRKRAPKIAAAVGSAAELAELPDVLPDELSEDDLAALGRDFTPVDPDGTVHPVEIGRRGRKPNEMVHLFTLNREKHYIPARPSAAVLVKFLKDVRRVHNDPERRKVIVQDMLVDVLGDENLAALASSPEVTEEDVADVFGIVSHICFARLREMERQMGNSSRGSRK